jgi:uncharacterized protein YneF (UPF0154 family)
VYIHLSIYLFIYLSIHLFIITRVPEKKERKREPKISEEIIAANFQTQCNNVSTQIQEVFQTPNIKRKNMKKGVKVFRIN